MTEIKERRRRRSRYAERLTLRISRADSERLREIADEKRVPASDIVREALSARLGKAPARREAGS